MLDNSENGVAREKKEKGGSVDEWAFVKSQVFLVRFELPFGVKNANVTV